jgi:hypothetical protein
MLVPREFDFGCFLGAILGITGMIFFIVFPQNIMFINSIFTAIFTTLIGVIVFVMAILTSIGTFYNFKKIKS